MAEYIERDALLKKAIKEQRFVFWKDDVINNERVVLICYKDLADVVRSIPAADVVPVVHGKWEKTSKCYGAIAGHCSICGLASGLWYVNMPYKYCPYCGARMDGDRE